VARRSGLGKGLGSLIPTTERLQDSDAILRELPISEIVANTYQPRSHFDEEALVSLSASIRSVGVLQPILVRELGEDSYELIAGERRWRAAKRAGLQTIPAIVRTAEDEGSLEQALVENLHREDLGALEEAAAYQQLIEEFSEGQLSAGHARALLGTPDRAFQEKLAKAIVSEKLTVREVEDRVREHGGTPEPEAGGTTPTGTKPPTIVRPAPLLELEEMLSDHLDTRVAVSMGQRKGRIVIDFSTLEDLERVYRVIVDGKEPMD